LEEILKVEEKLKSEKDDETKGEKKGKMNDAKAFLIYL